MSFAIAGPLYYIFNRIWPVDIYPIEHMDAPKTREFMRATDGFFEDDVINGLRVGELEHNQFVVEQVRVEDADTKHA